MLQEGYQRLEARLLDAGSNLFSDPSLAAPGPIVGMTVTHAIELLRIRRWREDTDERRGLYSRR